jgi:Zn-dependent protease
MPNTRQRSFRLFRLAGIDVFLNWSWFLVAIYEVQARNGSYSSVAWNVFEYLALFVIVLMHEFGHALACRSVGGTADHIMLWPFGGVAYVNPPQRPGATLWSLAAGPLVNVALAPLLWAAVAVSGHMGWAATMPNFDKLLQAVLWIDISLLIFNLLPIYPLDGGQILRSLLWYVMGRGRSLMTATVLGFFGLAGFIAMAVWMRSIWLGAMAVYLAMNCWNGFRYAQSLRKFEKLPRRAGFACPSCHTAPPLGDYWRCGNCQQSFDTFATGGVCPHCATQFAVTRCLDCQALRPMSEWGAQRYVAPAVVSSSFETR